MWSRFALCLSLVLLACWSAQAQLSSSPSESPGTPVPASMQPSPGIVQPSSQTMPSGENTLLILKPLLERALTSSEDSDQKLRLLEAQIKSDNEQRQKDNDARTKEQKDSATRLGALSARVETLQSYFDKLSHSLTDFSGTEEERQARALSAVDDINKKAKVLEFRLGIWKGVGITFGVGIAAIGVYEAGHNDWDLGPIHFKKIW